MSGVNRVMAIVLAVVLISAGDGWAQKVKPWKNITATAILDDESPFSAAELFRYDLDGPDLTTTP